MGRAITILGMGRTCEKYGQDLPSHCTGEIWGCNNGYMKFPGIKFDRMFELHSLEYLKTWKANAQGHDHFTRLDMLDCPVFTQGPVLAIRQSRRYPFESVFRHFGTNYCLGSPSYMAALAIFEGVSEIRAFGIDTADETHRQQRSSWAWWMCMAHNRNITITGTAMDFMTEKDQDQGLDGLRESIGDKIAREDQHG